MLYLINLDLHFGRKNLSKFLNVHINQEMDSIFAPVSDVIENNDIFSQHVIDVVHNFITSFTISPKTNVMMESDKEFPRFIKNLISILHNSQTTQDYNLPLQIIDFLNELSQNPNIIEIISKEINIDLLMTTFFGNGSDKTISNYSKYFHFLSLQATTTNMIFTKMETSEILFSIICSAIHTRDLQYWTLILTCLLARNYSDFMSYVKMNHDFNQFKQDVNNLLTNENRAVAGAAFSAALALSPLNEDYDYAISASKKLFETGINDELFLYVIALSIQDLEQKHGIGNECFCSMFISLLNSTGINAYEVSKILCELKPSYAHSLTPSEIRAFIVYLIQCNESYVSMSCCALLYYLVDAIPDIFVTLDNPFELFKNAMKKFKHITPMDVSDKFQSLLYLMRLLVNSPGIKSKVSSYLKLNEEFLFMQFQRRIELEDGVMSASFFHFLMECSLFMDGWNQRIRKCVLDSKFPSLLCSIVLTSKNKREISCALLAMQLLLSDASTQYIYFENFTSSIYTMNTKAYDNVEETMLELEKEKKCFAVEKKDYEDTINQLQTRTSQLEASLAKERKENAKQSKQLSKVTNELDKTTKAIATKEITTKQLSRDNEDLERNLKNLNEDNVKLAKKLARYRSKLAPLKEMCTENEELRNKLKISNNRYEVLLNKNGIMEAQLAQYKDTFLSQSNEIIAKGKLNASLEIRLQEAENQISQNEETIRDLKHQVESSTNEISELKATVSLETSKRTTFELSMKQLDLENKNLKKELDEKTSTIQSQTSQISILKQTLAQLKKQNKKLAGIATFDNKIHNAQNTTIQSLFGEPTF